MAGAVTMAPKRTSAPRRATSESSVVKIVLILITTVFFALFLVLPLGIIFHEAFARGWDVFVKSLADRASLHAIQLTLVTAAITVPLNTIFGVMAAWAVTMFQFRGRSLLISFIDLPLWVSPVVGGLIYVLVFGRHGWLGPWLFPSQEMIDSNFIARFIYQHDIKIIYALPGIVLATTFVTFPFVARGLIPLLQAHGHKEEEAAMTLGANGWQIFWHVTLPKIKWGMIYGIILCNARSMGEFGAVSVVAGAVQGRTATIPLQIEVFYNSYPNTAAFVLAAVLSVLALVTLFVKTYAEWRAERQLREAAESVQPNP